MDDHQFKEEEEENESKVTSEQEEGDVSCAAATEVTDELERAEGPGTSAGRSALFLRRCGLRCQGILQLLGRPRSSNCKNKQRFQCYPRGDLRRSSESMAENTRLGEEGLRRPRYCALAQGANKTHLQRICQGRGAGQWWPWIVGTGRAGCGPSHAFLHLRGTRQGKQRDQAPARGHWADREVALSAPRWSASEQGTPWARRGHSLPKGNGETPLSGWPLEMTYVMGGHFPRSTGRELYHRGLAFCVFVRGSLDKRLSGSATDSASSRLVSSGFHHSLDSPGWVGRQRIFWICDRNAALRLVCVFSSPEGIDLHSTGHDLGVPATLALHADWTDVLAVCCGFVTRLSVAGTCASISSGHCSARAPWAAPWLGTCRDRCLPSLASRTLFKRAWSQQVWTRSSSSPGFGIKHWLDTLPSPLAPLYGVLAKAAILAAWDLANKERLKTTQAACPRQSYLLPLFHLPRPHRQFQVLCAPVFGANPQVETQEPAARVPCQSRAGVRGGSCTASPWGDCFPSFHSCQWRRDFLHNRAPFQWLGQSSGCEAHGRPGPWVEETRRLCSHTGLWPQVVVARHRCFGCGWHMLWRCTPQTSSPLASPNQSSVPCGSAQSIWRVSSHCMPLPRGTFAMWAGGFFEIAVNHVNPLVLGGSQLAHGRAVGFPVVAHHGSRRLPRRSARVLGLSFCSASCFAKEESRWPTKARWSRSRSSLARSTSRVRVRFRAHQKFYSHVFRLQPFWPTALLIADTAGAS